MDPVGGAALGAAFGELFKLVIEVAETTYLFKSRLNHIKKTLDSIGPVIKDISEFDNRLKRIGKDTDAFLEQLEAGIKLINKCSKIKPWNVVGKYEYSKKLAGLEKSLLWFMQVPVQVKLASNSMKTLVTVEGVDDKLDILLSKMSILENGGGGGSCNVPGLPDLIVGLDKPLKELKKMILEFGVSVVVLSAPGGTGKTTLSKMLCKDKEIQDNIGKNTLFVTVSQKASLKDIVLKIFQHSRQPNPVFQNNEDMMNQLESLMRRLVETGPILLVLDDVWSEWNSYIQKFNFGIPNYKILITSRFVFQNFDHTYKLDILSEKDSTTLFCHFALKKDSSSKISEELIKEVVKGCKGSPLVLGVVGRSLYGLPKSSWTNTLKKWSEGKSIFDSNQQELLLPLQTSLDAFEENDISKECFLDLGSFPEDQKITATLLLDMWIESYGQAEEDALDILLNLSFRNLFSLSPLRKDAIEVDSYINERYVTQHDLLRELAIYQSNQESLQHRKRLFLEIRDNSYPKWWIKQQQQPNSARLLSISTDETFMSAWTGWYNIHLPSTEVLILNFNSKRYTFPPIIKEMNELKVLIVTNYGSFPVELIDFQLLKYVYNLKRIQFQHVSIPSLATFSIQLKNLQKISLMMCQISKAFDGCTSETANIFPNLTELNLEYCDDLVVFPVGFCNLLNLKKLRISYCSELFALPDELGKLVNLEMLIIDSCTKLEELPESICELFNLSFLDISGCTRMTRMPEQIGMLKNLKVLLMRGCVGIQDLPTSVEDLSKLKEVVCDEEILYLWKAYMYQIGHLNISVVKEDVDLDWLHTA